MRWPTAGFYVRAKTIHLCRQKSNEADEAGSGRCFIVIRVVDTPGSIFARRVRYAAGGADRTSTQAGKGTQLRKQKANQ